MAGVYLEGHAKKNGCHQGKCGVDGDTLDGLAYFDQFEALILLGLLGLVAAVAVTARRRRHPVVIGTVASLGAFVVIASEIWVALHR